MDNGRGMPESSRTCVSGARLLRVGPLAYAAEYIPEDEPLLAARANAAELGGTEPVYPAVGATLRFLACAVGARTVVEIGTGCGSSGIWLLRGMRPGSTLTSVDTEPEYHRMARKAFTQAGFAQNQCRLILGRALDVLPRLSDGAYDMVFCDADVRDYPDYLAAALRLLRTGGVVAFNNALPSQDGSEIAEAAADLADQVRADDRLAPVLVPLGNGLLAAVKRGD
jgi:predicted O-methyltransferase YrrM